MTPIAAGPRVAFNSSTAMMIVWALFAYIVGAVPFGYLVARSRGVDIFAAGSGNIGATNVGRVLGRKFGLLVFSLDFLKGALPTLAARLHEGHAGELAVAVGLATIVGHMFPVFLRFRGGKGVATGFGVVSVLLPFATAASALVWATLVSTTRYMSLGSVVAGLALASLRVAATPKPFGDDERTLTLFALLVAALVAVRHRSNVARLMAGRENRLRDSSTLRMLARVLHVLAMSLWFGGGVFFSLVAAPQLFATFQSFINARPEYLPLPTDLNEDRANRLAGAAVGPMFPPYFALQGACGLVALATALAFARREPESRVHRVRFVVLAIAMAGVLAGWPLVAKVSELRVARYADESLRGAFGMWHGISLLLNFVVLGLVGIGAALVAALPGSIPRITDPHDSI